MITNLSTRVQGAIPSKNSLALALLTVSMLWEITALMPDRLVINEVVSNNGSSLIDYSGDFPDWIELFNGTDAKINLNGYSLTDDATDTFKWKFGPVIIEPSGFLVVFASGKSPSDANDEIHASFRANEASCWHYGVAMVFAPFAS